MLMYMNALRRMCRRLRQINQQLCMANYWEKILSIDVRQGDFQSPMLFILIINETFKDIKRMKGIDLTLYATQTTL